MNVETATKLNPHDELAGEQQQRLSQILADYMDDVERGVPRDRHELMAKHPELAGALQWYLDGLDFLRDVVPNLETQCAAASSLIPDSHVPDSQAPDSHVPGSRCSGNLSSSSVLSDLPELPQRELGDFRILGEIGRGGMGVVYEAQQISLGRKVALKVLPFAAVLDQKQITRFNNEAQAAGQLNHPNIVPVYSVGCERGVHYYSMQLIDGQPLDRAIHELQVWAGEATCELGDPFASTIPFSQIANGKARTVPCAGSTVAALRGFSTARSVRSRDHILNSARLGVQAAEALHHAHEFGIVHRDIKPSNLLIDQQGKLWITDFGLARFQAGKNITMTGDLLGTARYMSPEQASGKSHLVDHRSDIYSLGVTLYELLTLRFAFDAEERVTLMHQIDRDDPPSLRQLNPAIPIDLETILFKSISKSRDDRYDSAQDLADDLKRFLDGKPTLARRPRLLDRAAKWAGRHRPLVASVLAALLLAFLGTSIAALLISREQQRTAHALDASNENYRRSQASLRQAREVVDRFGMQLANRLADAPGMEQVRQSLLQETLRYYETFVEQSEGDAALRFDLALSYSKIAGMRQQLGSHDGALEAYSKATGLYTQLAKEQPDVERFRHDLAICYNNLGQLLFQQGKMDESLESYQRALLIQRAFVAADPAQDIYAGALATTLTNLGSMQRLTGRLSPAKMSYSEAVTILERVVASQPELVLYQGQLAILYNELSFLLGADNVDQAERYNRLALAIHQRMVEADPEGLKPIAELATCYNNRGAIFRRNQRSEEAHEAYASAIELQEQLVLRAPSLPQFQHELGVSYNNLGQLLAATSPEVAARQFERAETLFQTLIDRSATVPPKYRASLGGVLNNIGLLLENAGQFDGAVDAYGRAIEHQARAFQEAPQLVEFRVLLSTTYVNYGRALRKQGLPVAAAEVAALRKALWPGVGERLYRIAAEMGEAVAMMSEDNRVNTEACDRWADTTVTTLEEALAAGYRHQEPLASDPSFRSFSQHESFRVLTEQNVEVPRGTRKFASPNTEAQR